MDIKRKQIQFELPILMTEDEGQFILISKELAIFIQDSSEEGAKKLFEKSLDLLLEKWEEEDKMLDQLRLHSFLKLEKKIYIHEFNKKLKYTMPNLELGKHSKIEFSI